jgi:hypothetical protein
VDVGGRYETDREWALTALAAGLVFAAWAMGVALFTSRVWAVPQGVAVALALAQPDRLFHLQSFLLGLAGELLVSFVLGSAFLGMAAALDIRGGGLVTAGVGFGLIVYGFVYFPLLRILMAPNGWPFLSSNPEWSWALALLMYGSALGLLAAYWPARARLRRRPRRTL